MTSGDAQYHPPEYAITNIPAKCSDYSKYPHAMVEASSSSRCLPAGVEEKYNIVSPSNGVSFYTALSGFFYHMGGITLIAEVS